MGKTTVAIAALADDRVFPDTIRTFGELLIQLADDYYSYPAEVRRVMVRSLADAADDARPALQAMRDGEEARR